MTKEVKLSKEKHNPMLSLIKMQLRNKLDLKWLKNQKSLIRTIVLSVLKFVAIAAFAFIILYLMEYLALFYFSEIPRVMILAVAFSLFLSLVSCTFGLMNTLYFSEDNKVLITMPVSSNKIFLSKILVYCIYEIKRSFSLLVPITLGCSILLIYRGMCSWVILLWMWIPLFFIVILPVFLGALLSIPLMYIKLFLKKHSILEIILFTLLLCGGIALVVYLISLIPENIDLINQWGYIRTFINNFLLAVEKKLQFISQMVYAMIGTKGDSLKYSLNWMSLVRLIVLASVVFVFAVIGYLIARPLFFKMMSKSFEVTTGSGKGNKNVMHNKYVTFINKELKINLRTMDISINYLMIYIIVPIAILLLNSIFAAMETKMLGDIMIYTANILLICLPMLASNSLIATYYSREGRAGYLKKTKPIYARYPLLSKLFFNVIFSIPSVFASIAIFGSFSSLRVLDIILLGFGILFLHLGHMLWCAMLDIMNPQNEQYATTKTVEQNPNEDKGTIIAFVLSFAYAIFSYKLFSEALLGNDTLVASIKLMLIGLVVFIILFILLTLNIKAYYYDK